MSAEDLKLASPLMKAAGRRALALCAPEVPLELRRQFLELATHCGNYRACSFVLGDMEEAQKTGMIALTHLLALNQEEASALLGCPSGHTLNENLLAEYAATYTATHRALRLVVSVGSKGAYGFEGGQMQYCPAPVLRPKSTAGAGDALLSGVASALAAGIPFISPDEGGKKFSGRTLRTALDFGVLNRASALLRSTPSIPVWTWRTCLPSPNSKAHLSPKQFGLHATRLNRVIPGVGASKIQALDFSRG